ncbi:MAG TPA: penicillin acylase family protein [Candidatus Marinimicrobia bacterium]|nr:penicillin acylase family protein [Candidatus Neomarinimicrobiota bacterium]
MRKKVLSGFLLLVLALILGGWFFLHNLQTRALPKLDGEMMLGGLNDAVQVYRDEYGVPAIEAQNESDLYYATGYLMAQDRLWQMDLLRRVTLGRLSEIFGEDLVQTDLLLRALQMSKKSEKILAECSEHGVLDALNAFTAGVNDCITDLGKKLPPEFAILGYKPEPWKVVYSVNLIGYMAWDLTMPYSSETILHKIRHKLGDEYFQSLIPDLAAEKTIVHPELSKIAVGAWSDLLLEHSDILEKIGAQVFSGSNNWAAGPEKTQSGKPLFSNDMHLGFSSPGIWYPLHQYSADGLHVTGLVLPGQPFVIAGHNERIAWGMTNVMVDDMDFYLEKTDPARPDHYLYMDQWLPMEIQTETIAIKGGESVIKKIRRTHHGPVISEFKKMGDELITMRWLGFDMSNELRSVYLLNRAQNWDDFRQAARFFIAVSQNIAYADIEGNIALQTCAGVPLRNKGDGLNIVPGWTDEYEWKGVVPFEELPYTFNPPSHTVSSANNKTVGDDYPYHISYWYASNYRIDRIRQMLNEKETLNSGDFMAMLTDFNSMMKSEYLPGILLILHEQVGQFNKTEAKAFEILKNWDGSCTIDNGGAAIFEQLYVSLVENLLKDEMGDSLYMEYASSSYLARWALRNIWNDNENPWIDNVHSTDHTESLDEIVAKSFQDAVEKLSQLMGSKPETWAWGKIHTLTLKHPMGDVPILDKFFGLNRGPFAAPGSFHTASPFVYKLSQPYDVVHGPSHRHIYDLSDWDKSYVVIPTGASGIPASPFYLNQAEIYMNGQYRQDFFSMEKVRAAAEYQLSFLPKN